MEQLLHVLTRIHILSRQASCFFIKQLSRNVAEERRCVKRGRKLGVCALVPVELWICEIKSHVIASIEKIFQQRPLQCFGNSERLQRQCNPTR